MSHELICSWLGLPGGQWPPDHYCLLGLEPAKADSEHIEQQVHQRLEMVRRYQLLHPDLVTEAMNRLAQAYICLTDPEARRAYDSNHAAAPSLVEKTAAMTSSRVVAPADPVPETVIPVPMVPPAPSLPDLLSPSAANSLPPSEATFVLEVPAALAEEARVESSSGEYPTAPEPVGNLSEPGASATAGSPVLTDTPESDGSLGIPAALQAAEAFPLAGRGLGTRRALYRRLAATCRLQRAWTRVGHYLSVPSRRLNRPSEAIDLINGFEAVRTALDRFPPLLGNAGQPGYSVVILARQPAPVPIFQTLLPSQRETLAQHWQWGQDLLHAYRQYLHQEMQVLRPRESWAGPGGPAGPL